MSEIPQSKEYEGIDINQAEQGDPDAQFNLGLKYLKGEGVPWDSGKAIFWFVKSAEQGDSYAQVNLGVLYCKGKGVPRDIEKAAFWFTKSAEQGNDEAKKYLENIKG